MRPSRRYCDRAGCKDADIVIALTSSDEINMIACQIALHDVSDADQDCANPGQ